MKPFRATLRADVQKGLSKQWTSTLIIWPVPHVHAVIHWCVSLCSSSPVPSDVFSCSPVLDDGPSDITDVAPNRKRRQRHLQQLEAQAKRQALEEPHRSRYATNRTGTSSLRPFRCRQLKYVKPVLAFPMFSSGLQNFTLHLISAMHFFFFLAQKIIIIK